MKRPHDISDDSTSDGDSSFHSRDASLQIVDYSNPNNEALSHSRGRRSDGGQGNDEDDEKRRIRRERNKLAAAKCRQRRVDLTNQLLEETSKLEDEQRRLSEEIEHFEKRREELQYVIDSHLLSCKLDNTKMAEESVWSDQKYEQDVKIEPQPPAATLQTDTILTFSSAMQPHTQAAAIESQPVRNDTDSVKIVHWPNSPASRPNVLPMFRLICFDGLVAEGSGLTPIGLMPSIVQPVNGTLFTPILEHRSIEDASNFQSPPSPNL